MWYKYVTDNNLENIQTYMYSEYFGMDFLNAYMRVRKNSIVLNTGLDGDVESNMIPYLKSETSLALFEIWKQIRNTKSDSLKEQADCFVKRFEVKKRLYGKYEAGGKFVAESGYNDYILYILLGFISSKMYTDTGNLKYLNCLLKVVDTLISAQDNMDLVLRKLVSLLIMEEMGYVRELAEAKGVHLEEK